jgi:hypothetical protein
MSVYLVTGQTSQESWRMEAQASYEAMVAAAAKEAVEKVAAPE